MAFTSDSRNTVPGNPNSSRPYPFHYPAKLPGFLLTGAHFVEEALPERHEQLHRLLRVHIPLVDVSGLELTLMAIRADGSVLGVMTIQKTN